VANQVAEEAQTVETAADKVAAEEKSVAEAAAAEQAVSEKLDQVESKVAEDESLAKAEAAPAAQVATPTGEETAACPGCHDEKPVYVGRKNIPAQDTRSVLVLGNPDENKEKWEAVETPEQLLTDPKEIHNVEDGLPAVADQIANIHNKVEEIKNSPLVPPTEESR
jgi:uncharacterized coiled-coil protein SlyX